MDATDTLLNQHRVKSIGVDGKPVEYQSTKYDIVSECQTFLKAEDGGGDTHANVTAAMDQARGGTPPPPTPPPRPCRLAVYRSAPPPPRKRGAAPPLLSSLTYPTEKSKFPVTSTPCGKRESPSEQNGDSNPECDIEGVPDLPLDEGLPSTVTVLEAPGGGKVYLVGTAHFSLQSQEDVSKVIREVCPHIVMVELCEQRTNILLLDEEVILNEAKNINVKKIRSIVAQNGVLKGLMYVLLLNMSAQITRELGMAPGGEFRRAMAEAKKIPDCIVQLGDRAIDITLQRAIASLTWGQTIRFIWHMLTSNQSISAEEVEKCKQKKMLEEMLEEMSEEFPPLKRVFVVERDMYLCHSLQVAALQPRREPCRIVGVVGMGHVAGMVELWGKITSQDIPPLLTVPPPSLSTRVLRASVRLALIGGALYAGYRLFPRRLLP